MRPGGHVFVYSHVRKNSWLAGGLKASTRWRGSWNASAWWTCGRSAFASRTT